MANSYSAGLFSQYLVESGSFISEERMRFFVLRIPTDFLEDMRLITNRKIREATDFLLDRKAKLLAEYEAGRKETKEDKVKQYISDLFQSAGEGARKAVEEMENQPQFPQCNEFGEFSREASPEQHERKGDMISPDDFDKVSPERQEQIKRVVKDSESRRGGIMVDLPPEKQEDKPAEQKKCSDKTAAGPSIQHIREMLKREQDQAVSYAVDQTPVISFLTRLQFCVDALSENPPWLKSVLSVLQSPEDSASNVLGKLKGIVADLDREALKANLQPEKPKDKGTEPERGSDKKEEQVPKDEDRDVCGRVMGDAEYEAVYGDGGHIEQMTQCCKQEPKKPVCPNAHEPRPAPKRG